MLQIEAMCAYHRYYICPVQIRSAKPGILSEELRKSLGMGDNTPPPWLINMQRYGPPPSYPDLRVSFSTAAAAAAAKVISLLFRP